MTCEAARKDLTLYLYGELDLEQEELLEQHLDVCEGCQQELTRQRSLLALFDNRQHQPSAELLDACRRELMSRVHAARETAGFGARVRTALARTFLSPALLRPVGAMALLAAGFTGGLALRGALPTSDPVVLRVRNLSPAPQGGVQLVLEEVRQRTMHGALDDDNIRRLLLAAATDPSDAGLRARTLDILKDRCERTDVRNAFLVALREDPNPGVRLKALEALKPSASEPETQRVLSQVLLADDNPGVRTMAIDLLAGDLHADVIGALQELILRESNPYIRQKTAKALLERNATLETF